MKTCFMGPGVPACAHSMKLPRRVQHYAKIGPAMKWFGGVLLLSIGLAQASGLPAVSERVWAKPDHFWWRRSVPGGNLWLTVDARHGAKTPLFDHQRLAIELSLRS